MAGAPPEARAYALVVEQGPDAGARFDVQSASPTPLLLGTSPACELRLTDVHTSRRHASIDVVAGGVRLVDLDSTNGTFVGALRVFSALLTGGESIRVGETTLRLERSDATSAATLSPRAAFGPLVGGSEEMRRLHPLLERLAASDVPVIIEGETGTGKEVLAEALHEQGPRRDAPFIVFDCTAVPANLLESALFGHEKGSFTGASGARQGVFEQADGGTLLIDEIGELDLALQPKLLRAIQRSEVQRVGGSKWIKVDVRVLAATRRDLDREVQAGRFRDDLFFRLNVARVELPPLRRRRDDIAPLARHFWRLMGGDEATLTPALVARLEAYPWPGNVRELHNAVARHLALGDLAQLDDPSRARPVDAPEDDAIGRVLARKLGLVESREHVLREFERRYLQQTLDAHGGNVTRAAEAAGIARRYFHMLLAKRDLSSR
jgi:DNA-binding NtrC family response regulator